MGLGFTVGLTCIGLVREFLGNGSVFNLHVLPSSYEPISIFIMAPGAFFVLACLTALQNKFKAPSATNVSHAESLSCGGNCATCTGSVCLENHKKIEEAKKGDK